MSALVIIPAFNEAATLPAVLGALADRTAPGKAELDIVVVDDGSTDDTERVARDHGATVLRLPYNLGIGGALRTGFRYAVERDYQHTVQMDADGQHDDRDIEALLDALSGADLVIGSRFSDAAAEYQVGWVRRRAMRLLEVMIRRLTGRTFTDTSSGFRAFNRPVLDYFAVTYPSDYMESVEALVAALNEGFRVAEVPVLMHQRVGGAPSNHRLKLGYHYVRVVVSLILTARPHRAQPAARATGS